MSHGQTKIEGGIEYFDCGDGQWDRQCARCGSSTVSVDCWSCGGEGTLGSDCIDDMCHGGECIHGDSGEIRCDICGGEGGWEICGSGREWCTANPMPGREAVKTTASKDDDVPEADPKPDAAAQQNSNGNEEGRSVAASEGS